MFPAHLDSLNRRHGPDTSGAPKKGQEKLDPKKEQVYQQGTEGADMHTEYREIRHGKVVIVNSFGRRETWSINDLRDVAHVNALAMDRFQWAIRKMGK